MQQDPRRTMPWKPIAIVLAIVLLAILILAALVVTGVMNLGWSLL